MITSPVTLNSEEPLIIQGGMGVAVSNWHLARAVSEAGQLGVVSGTGINLVLVERLRNGVDTDALNRAFAAFPFPKMVESVLAAYQHTQKPIPMFRFPVPPDLAELTILANFCEVFLAKEGHSGKVGINYLEKIQLPHLPSIYGAMLAGVDYVLMGAGIPREIPMVLDQFSRHETATLKLHVEEALPEDAYVMTFTPPNPNLPPLTRPQFLAIVSSYTLAMTLARKSVGHVDGFVVEGPCAGGHNASPRGKLELTPLGEPIYGERDAIDIEKIKALGLPFWLAGHYDHPDRLQEALVLGASGIQAGTIFAFSDESGLEGSLKTSVLQEVQEDTIRIFTDPLASPTGFPFKVVGLADTLSEASIYDARPRLCQRGFLRTPYKRDNDKLGYRCPSEPVRDYLAKGGCEEDTIGRKCLCNGLMANIGFPQTHVSGYVEKPLITAGDTLKDLKPLLYPDHLHYSVRQVLSYLLPGNVPVDLSCNTQLQQAL